MGRIILNKALLLFCFMTLWSHAATADTLSVKIIAPHFAFIIKEDGTGVYQKTLHEAARRAGVTIEETVLPIQRAVITLFRREALCLYGMVAPVKHRLGPDGVALSYPLGVAKLHVFTPADTSPVQNWTTLHGKNVAVSIGYKPYVQPLLQTGIKIQYVPNEEGLLDMLHSGRVDALVAFLPDFLQQAPRLSYSPHHPVTVVYDSITCRNTPKGQRFVQLISAALREMHTDGTTRALQGPFYQEFDYMPEK